MTREHFACHGTTLDFTPCERPATIVVEHHDGEHLTYCKQHADVWSHRPQRPIAEPRP